MPLSRIHLRNLKEVADMGCVIVPPMLTFYNGSKTIDEQIFHIVGKVLLQFGISYDRFKPWTGC
jgi:4-hydroxy-3-polyprenylbenzoate decarboxylase